VVASILLAAIVGGVVFVALDNWQRRSTASAPEPHPDLWTPDTPPRRAGPLIVPRADTPAPFREHYPPEESVPPPARPGLWDDPRRDDDEDDRPPGLWSGWAR
jgi:hypothetical protein